MRNKDVKHFKVILELEVGLNITYELFPERVEECHGYHTFNEDEEVDRELESVIIHLDNGEKIDLTARLTDEEKKLIRETEL